MALEAVLLEVGFLGVGPAAVEAGEGLFASVLAKVPLGEGKGLGACMGTGRREGRRESKGTED